MKNMKMWKKLYSSDCKFCQQTQTLGHVGGCISSMREGRYNWRHDSVIVNMAKFITALKNVQVFADIDQYMSPSIITGEDLRPDLIVVHQSKATITRCDLSPRFFCIDATLLCKFESDKI